MSHYMTALAMKQTGLKPAAKIVLYWLADHHNESTGACFPSLRVLADECEMSKRAVQGHLDALEAAGLIARKVRARENGSQTSNGYVLNLTPAPMQDLPPPIADSATLPMQDLPPHNLGNNNPGNKPLSCDAQDRFEEFWVQYPHRNGAKKGKKLARESWDRAIKKNHSPDEMIAGAMRYAEDRQVLDGYAKNPSAWINQRGWEDDIEKAPRFSGNRSMARGQAPGGYGQGGSIASVVLRRRLNGEV